MEALMALLVLKYPVILVVLGGLIAAIPIAKFITKLTKSEKDDKVVEEVEKVVTSINKLRK